MAAVFKCRSVVSNFQSVKGMLDQIVTWDWDWDRDRDRDIGRCGE